MLRHGGNVVPGGLRRICGNVADRFQDCADKAAHHFGAFLDRLVGGDNRLRHGRKDLINRHLLHFNASRLDRCNPFGHARHGMQISGDGELDDATCSNRLNVGIGLGHLGGGEHPQKIVVSGILEGEHTDRLAFQIGRPGNATVLAPGKLRQTTAAEQGHAANIKPVGAHDDGRVPDASTEIGIPDSHLRGHVRTALANLEGHVEVCSLEIALAFGELKGREGGQEIRCREKICHLFSGKDRGG